MTYNEDERSTYRFLDLRATLRERLACSRQHLLILGMVVHHILWQLIAAMNTQAVLIVEHMNTLVNHRPLVLLTMSETAKSVPL